MVDVSDMWDDDEDNDFVNNGCKSVEQGVEAILNGGKTVSVFTVIDVDGEPITVEAAKDCIDIEAEYFGFCLAVDQAQALIAALQQAVREVEGAG